LYTLPLRLRSLFRRSEVEQELDDELQYHLERQIEESIARGLTPEEARYAALRAMGGIEQRKEECRDARRVNAIENTIRDVHYGVRMLAKAPGFTAVAVLTLALGIGANTAIFSVVNAVLLSPLPFPDPNRMVQVMLSSPAWAPGQNANTASVPEFMVFREQRQALENVAAYDSGRSVNLTGIEPAEQLRVIHVSSEYFALFGVPVQVGRAFSAQEDGPGGPRLALISDGLWRRRFAEDRALVGRTLMLAGEPHTVIGVLGAGFAADPRAEVILPMQADPNNTNPAHRLRVAARLKPGVTLEMARAQLEVAHEQFLRRFPNWASANQHADFTAETLWDATIGGVRNPLLVIEGAVVFVLLIACANVANLLLARATGRNREIAIRAALGASRGRIASQLLIESLLLSLAGGALGLLLGLAGVRALVAISPGEIPRIGNAVTLDWQVLAFTLLLSVCTGLLFGMAPAFHMGFLKHTGAAFNDHGSRTGASLRQSRVRSMLVVAEMAMALVLLAGAGLLIRSFWALRTVDPGFDSRNILTIEMSLAGAHLDSAAALDQLISNAEQRIERLPGVVAVAATFSLPLENQLGGPVAVESLPGDSYGANFCLISRHYFDVFRIPVMRGRVFTDRDNDRAAPVVLMNKTMSDGRSAGMHWPSGFPWRHGDPLGQRITMAKGMGPPFEERTRQVIGVVGEVRDAGLNRNPLPMIYMPIAQITDGLARMGTRGLPLRWAVRTQAEPYSMLPVIERELRAASGGLPVAHVRSMDQVIAESTARNRFDMVLLSVFAGLALLLGAVGVYGLMAYTVQYRTREIGVRIALGASLREVNRIVVIEGMRLALIGVAIGLGGAIELTPLLGSLLFGVQASDPAVLASTAVVLSATALVATYIPARRATRVDPVSALRWE
jgi:predicted permease